MSQCLFCKLVVNKIPSYTVYEDDQTRAFLDIFPSAPGHTMVILKKHGETILDYTPQELGVLWGAVQKVTKALQKAFDTNIFTMGVNHGEPSGVHHLHVHLLPRFASDSGSIVQSIVQNKPKEDLTVIQKKIKKHIV